MAYKTHVGSLDAYDKGTIELADDLRKYAFSNVYEVAGKAAPFERVAVVQNLEYVAEAVRVEGESPWYAAPHDEFAIVMDGEVSFRFVKLEDDQVPHHEGGAVKHGISTALSKFEPMLRPTIKAAGFLTRDSRVVERKKYGRAKARKSFQFSKR